MIKIVVCLSLVLVSGMAQAQNVQWAAKVLDYSSQLSDYEYAARQILGSPNVLPNAGDNPNAWLPDNPDKISFIKVGFDEPAKIEQVAIAESYSPGSVYQIFLYEPDGKEHLLTALTPRELKVKGRMLNIYFNVTDYEINAVKVVIDGSRVPGYNAIDAIGISGSKVPVNAEREVALRRNPGLTGEVLSLAASGNISDSRPVFSYTLNRLYFTRGYSPENMGFETDPGDIWMADLNPSYGELENIRPMSNNINNIGLNTSCGYYSINGKEILLLGNITGKVNKVKSNVVMVYGNDGNWLDINEQNIKRAKLASFDADYALADNGNVLFISTLRYDTEGGRDLYVCYHNGNNNWSEPINLGSKVNTAHNEYSPFYSGSEEALYFSTAGYSGFGEGDIYRIVRQDDSWENWTAPENIGSDINTRFDEKYFYFDEGDEHAYFARSDTDSLYHIIKVDRPEFMRPVPRVVLRGQVKDAITQKPVSSEVTVLLMPEQYPYGITISDETSGEFEIFLPSGNQYVIVGEKDGYESQEITLSLENRDEPYRYDLDLALMAISEDTSPDAGTLSGKPDHREERDDSARAQEQERSGTTAVSDVLFEFNSTKPVIESISVLDRIVEFLAQRPDIKVEIAGFTDHIGNELFNTSLARERALTVKGYLVEAGITPARIRVIGFGEKMPLIISNDIRDLQINRRVEFNFTK